MRVLFAVNDENIAASIEKKYRKDYKEIITYKSVYYFNAILKELQRNKNYDRVVISEDLEEFTSSSFEQKDKFIFDKLDNISDEAVSDDGVDIPIILICSDRRDKGEEILAKLFGIGIYNAIIGDDRSIDEVCRLINKPRSKKESKIYYQINSEVINYQNGKEDDVKEEEIQNILLHFKKLAGEEDKYVESFENIATQYNDEQLKIIVAVLPAGVKTVLRQSSPEYQRLMRTERTLNSDLYKSKNENKSNAATGVLLGEETKEKLKRPVVVPTTLDKNVYKEVKEKKKIDLTDFEEEEIEDDDIIPNEVEELETKPKRRGRPRKNPIPEETAKEETAPKRRGRPRKNEPIETLEEDDDDNILPGFDEDEDYEEDVEPENEVKEVPQKVSKKKADVLPGFDDEDYEEDIEEQEEIEEVPQKVSKKKADVLPGFDDDDYEEDIEEEEEIEEVPQKVSKKKADVLPGFDDDDYDYEEDVEPEEDNNDNMLTKFYENDEYEEDGEDTSKTFNPSKNTKHDEILEEENDNEDSANELNSYNEKNYDDDSETTYEESYTTRNRNTSLEKYNNVFDEDFDNLLIGDKKIATFVGTSKNGTSFIVNNIAQILSEMGINTAILDTTKNRNSYYIYTNDDEDLRKAAINSIDSLINDDPHGLQVNENLSVYTSLPNEYDLIRNSYPILENLIKKHSIVLIDCDFDTPSEYFDKSQEIYLVQSMDVLTIQPLTEFLRELKDKDILDDGKIRIILNKILKLKGVSGKNIIGGMSKYNNPEMSLMKDLFHPEVVKVAATLPFDEDVYTIYLESLIECEIKANKYPKEFRQRLVNLAGTIYPLLPSGQNNKKNNKKEFNNYSSSFTSNMNDTLDNMRKKY